MIFADIPAGADVFIDANVLLYSLTHYPLLSPPSKALMDRIERGDVAGYTSAHVLSESAHRLMGLEAVTRFGWSHQGLAARLKRHPNEVRQLDRYRQAIDEIGLLGIRVLDTTGRLVSRAADTSRQFGLLGGDALTVAVMNEHGLTHLASNDADFDRVPGLTRYAPA
jgi:predicted nucleic acid-binding protein